VRDYGVGKVSNITFLTSRDCIFCRAFGNFLLLCVRPDTTALCGRLPSVLFQNARRRFCRYRSEFPSGSLRTAKQVHSDSIALHLDTPLASFRFDF
jgi:hypothetical protein